SPTSAITNASGVAQTMVKLGTTAGAGTVTASATGLAGSPVVFGTNAIAGAASRISLASGNNQSGTVALPLGLPLAVRIADANNNPVPNFPVSFIVTSGGGSIPSRNVTSNSQGIAQAGFILGPTVGANGAEAVTTGLLGSPVEFSAQSIAGAPAQMII